MSEIVRVSGHLMTGGTLGPWLCGLRQKPKAKARALGVLLRAPPRAEPEALSQKLPPPAQPRTQFSHPNAIGASSPSPHPSLPAPVSLFGIRD